MPDAKHKRIVICADGTWNDPEDENPTNALRIARAVKPIGNDGVPQVVFYDWGVGSYYATIRGGAASLGLLKNVQDSYRFIVQNYREGDELFLFGFSRGAYTVRCLAGMLNNCGILKRKNASEIPQAFDFYKQRNAKPGSQTAREWRKQHSGSPRRGAVRFIGVWDTVGALGVPTRMLAFVDEKDLFFDPILGSNVHAARHAVSIDEKRADLTPTLWDDRDATNIRQVWFAGVHADVGGGYAPSKAGTLASEIPLKWMADEAHSFGLQFEPQVTDPSRIDPLAPTHRSHKRFWRVLGTQARTIPDDAVVHSSVQHRFESGEYKSAPLQEWLARTGGNWTL
ncbi:MAG: DUF2235 domain-containing protein [Deltaproteobacteria bacterium]